MYSFVFRKGIKKCDPSGNIEVNPHKPSAFDIWALGITIVIGGQYFGWNFGLEAGFGSFAIATMLITSAYICLILCTSEITSGLPFAGGAYGLARVALGFYPGFVVGCSEAIEYIIYTANSAFALGVMICDLLSLDKSYQPLWWTLFYVSAVWIQIYGGRVFWYSNAVLAIVSIALVLIYCFGSLPYTNFDRYAGYSSTTVVPSDHVYQSSFFSGGGYTFMRCLPLAPWFFVGVESLAFASDDVVNPKRDLPIGSITCVLTLAATAILVLFITSSLPPGNIIADGDNLVARSLSPFDLGYSLIFNISQRTALIFSIPATYATAFGFIFPYGKLLESLSESNLLPTILRAKTTRGTPYMALISGSVIGYLVCILAYCVPAVASELFNICMLSGFIGYLSQCIGYIAMSTKFKSITREFHSPFGVYGAYYACAVFSLGTIALIGFQANQYAVICVLISQCILSAYYFLYAKYHQTFSPDESKIMFVAHVITYNTKKTKHNGKRKNPQSSGMSSMKSSNGSSLHPLPSIFSRHKKISCTPLQEEEDIGGCSGKVSYYSRASSFFASNKTPNTIRSMSFSKRSRKIEILPMPTSNC